MEVMTIVGVSSLAGFVAGYGVRAAISRRRRLRSSRSSRLLPDMRLHRLVQARGAEETNLPQQKAGGGAEEGPLPQQKAGGGAEEGPLPQQKAGGDS
jgi:hypothetical protein